MSTPIHPGPLPSESVGHQIVAHALDSGGSWADHDGMTRIRDLDTDLVNANLEKLGLLLDQAIPIAENLKEMSDLIRKLLPKMSVGGVYFGDPICHVPENVS